jgi:hypothetical protein
MRDTTCKIFFNSKYFFKGKATYIALLNTVMEKLVEEISFNLPDDTKNEVILTVKIR